MEMEERRVSDKVADVVARVANEPTVGMYYVEQHIQDVVPLVFRVQDAMIQHARHTQGFVDDARAALQVIEHMQSDKHFNDVEGLKSRVRSIKRLAAANDD